MRIRRLAVALVAVVLAGCGSDLTGTALPAEIDIRTLDVGSFPTEPVNAHDDDPVPDFYEMYNVAGMRIASHVIDAAAIDPRMKYGTGARAISDGTIAWEFGDDRALEPIAEKHKMLYGFLSTGASSDSTVSSMSWPSKEPTNKFTAATVVLQFPDAAAASAAAQEFHDVDLAAMEGRNQPVSIPGYPGARSHWRPDSPFLRTLLPHGPYVLGFLLSVDKPDQNALTALAATAYDKQIKALADVPVLTDEEIYGLPFDPDHLLVRALNPDQFTFPDGDGSHTVTSPAGALHYAGAPGVPLSPERDRIAEQFTAMKAEQVAFSHGTMTIRTADPASAQRAVTDKLFPHHHKADAAAPPNLPHAACTENRTFDGAKRFTCLVAYKEYVGVVGGSQLLDAHQRAAAQYALFANTR
ncbi:DUF7373 family lipoprotein [Nocardia caishijiensis]|uniref:Uncharacterized protein n=1 Tax=Nocardia caishijiensis TaxID=184756 RepID=A0ABQ6YRC2_9NOCA|nr:hypothetical protein [Nocardia caishijiensis]KAF0848340.1 hypothetical protein FNL39_102488 [Nocardia caishijiensis]